MMRGKVKTLGVEFILLSVFLFAVNCFALETGAPAPDFTLKTAEGEEVKLSDYRGKTVVLEWFNPGCPFVKNHYQTGNMPDLQERYGKAGVVWLTISSTSADHKDYVAPEKVAGLKESWKIKSSQVLLDPTGVVGRQYGAKTTPHMFIIDSDGKLIYQGAIDDDADASADPTKAENYVKGALDQVLAGNKVSKTDTVPYGCSVKYAEG